MDFSDKMKSNLESKERHTLKGHDIKINISLKDNHDEENQLLVIIDCFPVNFH